jgi:hypothetical protein
MFAWARKHRSAFIHRWLTIRAFLWWIISTLCIWRLRLIIYHYDLHLWYRMVYKGKCDTEVLLKKISRWHKRNIWFITEIAIYKVRVQEHIRFIKKLSNYPYPK